MDEFNFIQNRNNNVEEHNIDIEHGFNQLRHVMNKQVRTWWDIVTLEKNVENNMTPQETQMGC